jgi:hypothetical protein
VRANRRQVLRAPVEPHQRLPAHYHKALKELEHLRPKHAAGPEPEPASARSPQPIATQPPADESSSIHETLPEPISPAARPAPEPLPASVAGAQAHPNGAEMALAGRNRPVPSHWKPED